MVAAASTTPARRSPRLCAARRRHPAGKTRGRRQLRAARGRWLAPASPSKRTASGVEQALKRDGQPFIANACDLSPAPGQTSGQIWLLTAPTWPAKSTFLRQNALIALLAQIGSFVPRRAARIGIVDRLFSRVAPPTIWRAALHSWSRGGNRRDSQSGQRALAVI